LNFEKQISEYCLSDSKDSEYIFFFSKWWTIT